MTDQRAGADSAESAGGGATDALRQAGPQNLHAPVHPNVEELKAALREIRVAAGSAESFTNRLQFIHARAGCAIDGLPWNYGERQRQNGYKIRDRTMLENDELRAALRELVACKDLRERAAAFEHTPECLARPLAECPEYQMRLEYERRMPLAWAAARALVDPT